MRGRQTTADIYVQPIPRSVRESIEALDRTLSERPATPQPRKGVRRVH